MGRFFKIIISIIILIVLFTVGIFAGRSMLPPADQETVDAAIEQTVAAWPIPTEVPTYTPLPTYTPQPTSAPIIITVEHIVEREVIVTVIPATATRIPEPTATATVEAVTYVVADTDGDGVYLRRTAGGDDRIKAWPEGSEMVRIGKAVLADGRNWEHVRDRDGNEGFVPMRFLETEGQANAKKMLAQRTADSALAGGECTSATRRYIASLEDPLETLRLSMSGISRLSNQAARTPALLLDTDWRLEYVVYLAGMQVASETIIKMHPPSDASARRIHSSVVSAARLFVESATLIAKGLDSLDMAAITRGAQKIEQGTGHINRGADLLKGCIEE